MRNMWEADFEALNKAAGNGLRELREDAGWSKQRLGQHLDVSAAIITSYEAGLIDIPAAKLFVADKLFRSGGFDFLFWPYSRPELFSNPMANVIRFPKKLIR